MRRIASLLAVSGLALAASNANALQLLVDDFNFPGPGAVSAGDTTIGTEDLLFNHVLPGGSIATNRAIYQTLLANSQNRPTPTTVTVGGGATGNLDIDNGSGVDSDVRVRWTTSSFALPPGPYSILFDVLFSNNGTPNVDTQLTFNFDGAGADDFVKVVNIPATASPMGVFFNLSITEAGYLAGGGTLDMTISGNAAWDLTIDQFSIAIPEPTSLALVGLALLGAGVASRRRKA